MSRMSENIKPLIATERPRFWRYSYAAGPVRSKFLIEIRDNKKLLGTKCPECGRVYLPARATCIKCFVDMDEWVEVSYRGTLMSYTIVYQPLEIHPVETPFAYGIIQLDGADTGLAHMLGEIDFKDINVGMRLKVVFKDERVGDIRDIKYFKPV